MTAGRIGSGSPRIAVVQAEGPAGHRDLRAAVGVVPFKRDAEEFLTIVVRLDLDLRDEQGELLGYARPRAPSALWCDRPARPADATNALLEYASDFAIAKGSTDILLAGHARAAAPAQVIDGMLEILADGQTPTFVGTFSARAGQPSAAIPLRAPYLFVSGSVGRVHPGMEQRRFVAGEMLDVDPAIFQAADPPWRAAPGALLADSMLRAQGLFGVSQARIGLPGLEPVASADVLDVQGLPIPLTLDTLWLDTDEAVAALIWRGVVPLNKIEDFSRLVISLERVGAHRDPAVRMADTQRGIVHYAWTEDDAAEGKPPPGSDAVLEYHRHLTWGEVAPEPRVPIERYAVVSAQLAERPKERDKVLETHGYDEERWMIEDRAWLERFASNAMEGKAELAAYYGTLFLAAQDALASPEEDKLTLHDYAGLRAEIERAADPSVVFERAKVTLAQFMRLDRRWTARADADPAVAEELRQLLEELGADLDPLDAFDAGDADGEA